MQTIARTSPADESRLGMAPGTTATFWVLAAFLASGAITGIYALGSEILAAQAEALATDATTPVGTRAADLNALAQVEGFCVFRCQPRILVAGSAVRLAAAAALPAGQRAPLLARSRRDLDQARAAEPLNGAVLIQQAYAAALVDHPAPADVLALIERSYTVQPFSKTGGLWRIGAVTRNWDVASPPLKREALREAVWLPAAGVSETAVANRFESAGLTLQLDLARSLPPPDEKP